MKVLLLSSIDRAARACLEDRHVVVDAIGADSEEISRTVVDCEVVVLRSGTMLDRRSIERAQALQLVVRAGSGVDNVDLEALAERGVQLARIPEPGADAVAEMALALMLSVMRNVTHADRLLRDGRWAKSELTGSCLSGKVLGIVGAGSIGSRVGVLGTLLGMRAMGCVERGTPAASRRLAQGGIRLAALPDVLTRADVVSIHVPLTPRTRHMIDRAALRRMKPGSVLVNLSRGGVVDEDALSEALRDGHLAAAAVDVHEHEGAAFRSPLADLPNVVLTPHIGAGTREAQEQIGRRIVELVDACALAALAAPQPMTA